MESKTPNNRRVYAAALIGGTIIAAGALAGGCGGKAPPPTSKQPTLQAPQARPQTRPIVARRGTLYERLGGETVIGAVVNDFVTRAAADPAVNFTREGHDKSWPPTPQNLDRLKQRLVEFISTTAGGPTEYRGTDMVTAHRGMAITNAEFDALAGHFKAALEVNDVPRREREELLNAVSSMRGAIVEAPDGPAPTEPKADDTTARDPATTDAPPEEKPVEVAPEVTPDVAAPEQSNPDAASEAPVEPSDPSPAPIDEPEPESSASEPKA